ILPIVPLDSFTHQVVLSNDGSPGWVEHDAYGRETYHPGLPPVREDLAQTLESRPLWRFMYVSGWEGSFWAQTPADEIIRSIAEVARLAGARCAYTDQREYF